MGQASQPASMVVPVTRTANHLQIINFLEAERIVVQMMALCCVLPTARLFTTPPHNHKLSITHILPIPAEPVDMPLIIDTVNPCPIGIFLISLFVLNQSPERSDLVMALVAAELLEAEFPATALFTSRSMCFSIGFHLLS